MPDWRPSSGPAAAQRRAALLRTIRNYFEATDALEVDTPSLSRAAVSDPHIESLEVASTLSREPLYLHTSPEFAMKRLLAAGYPDIWSIARVYRDGEAGSRHQPEFTMLEWYRHNFDLSEIIEDTAAVIRAALGELPVSRIDFREAFIDACNVDPFTATVPELADAADADEALRATLGDARNDWLDLLFATRVAASFPRDRISIVAHFPADQAALARICPDDPALADRFEAFVGRHELANGYVELTDPSEQAARFDGDQQERERRGKVQRPLDTQLVDALRQGLPPCAGVALGIERLQMVLDGTDDIRDVITFGFEND